MVARSACKKWSGGDDGDGMGVARTLLLWVGVVPSPLKEKTPVQRPGEAVAMQAKTLDSSLNR